MTGATEVPRPLEGELVRLRALEESDGAVLNPYFCDPDVLANLTMTFPQPQEGFRGFWRAQRSDPDKVNFTIEERASGKAVGICGLEGLNLNAAPELGIWVAKPHWNRGLGTDAVRTLCRFAFGEMAKHRVTLHVYSTNPRAIRAYEKVGFRIEGTMREDMFREGRWIDTHVMGLLAGELLEG